MMFLGHIHHRIWVLSVLSSDLKIGKD